MTYSPGISDQLHKTICPLPSGVNLGQVLIVGFPETDLAYTGQILGPGESNWGLSLSTVVSFGLQSYNSNPPIQKRNAGKTRKARIQMITPRLALRGCLAVMILLVLLASLAMAQARKAPGTAEKWTPPHTPWGDPDLQGIWSNATLTPIERPKELGEKHFLTSDQAAELEERAAHALIALRQKATRVHIISSGSNAEQRSYLPSAHRS